MAGVAPVTISDTEWMLLRNVSFKEFTDFMSVAEDQGVYVALARLRHRFPKEFRGTHAARSASNGG